MQESLFTTAADLALVATPLPPANARRDAHTDPADLFLEPLDRQTWLVQERQLTITIYPHKVLLQWAGVRGGQPDTIVLPAELIAIIKQLLDQQPSICFFATPTEA
ncbi:MAG: hypothetical protein R3C14_40545 [Caldilineaceae bacterium]